MYIRDLCVLSQVLRLGNEHVLLLVCAETENSQHFAFRPTSIATRCLKPVIVARGNTACQSAVFLYRSLMVVSPRHIISYNLDPRWPHYVSLLAISIALVLGLSRSVLSGTQICASLHSLRLHSLRPVRSASLSCSAQSGEMVRLQLCQLAARRCASCSSFVHVCFLSL
jgi:hypothetical protein